MQIIPTVFEKEFNDAENRIGLVCQASNWIQIDVSDNFYTQGKSFELERLNKIVLPKTVLWDIHLMVKEPINWIEKSIFVGASRIIGQVEMMSNREEFIKKIKDAGLEAGLGFGIQTEIKDIPDETDEILIMGRKAGFESKDFDLKVLDKIKYSQKYEKIIGVDGGSNKNNIHLIEKSGADIVYSGNNYLELINDYQK